MGQLLRSDLIAGLAAFGIGHLPLTEIYVERGVVPARDSAGSPQTLADLARTPRARLTLEGGAGSGKSMTMRRLALACAAAVTGEPEGAAALLVDWPLPIPLPVTIEMPPQIDPGADPWSLIEAQLLAHDLATHTGLVLQALHAGEALVVIDGVTPHNAPTVTRLVATFPANRYMCACRPYAFADGQPGRLLQTHGFHRVHFAPLERAHIDAMVARLLTALNRRRVARDQASSTGATTALQRGGPLAEQIADLQGRLLIDDGLRTLTFEPLALAIAVVADADGHTLPAARAVVYRRVLAALWGEAEPSVAVLAPLALALQRASGDDDHPATLTRPMVEQLVRAGAPDADDTQVAAIIERALDVGLLAAPESEAPSQTYQMPQHALRMFLAAHALARADDFEAMIAPYVNDPTWHETLTLALWLRTGDPLSQPPRHAERENDTGAATLWHLIGRPDRSRDAGDADAVKKKSSRQSAKSVRHALQLSAGASAAHPEQAALLAASCLEAIDPQRYPDVLREVQQRLLAMIADPNVAVEDRVHAGLMLGRLGDPRFADPLPPLAQIDAGVFVFGANDAPYDEERPAQRIDLPSYQIGIYPVTNAEYARFLAARPGHPKPHYWYDPRFNNPAQPVVGVTWHDAVAYAAWLTRILAIEGRLPAGTVVRLPLETEWEKAATWGPRARVKRRFPWGDHWIAGIANVAETRAGPDGRSRWTTTPVGCFPGSVSLYGVHDLIGNVWEWTASSIEAPPRRSDMAGGARTSLSERLHGDLSGATGSEKRRHYILRGSSFNSTTAHARATYRGSHLPPDYWRYNIGFRVVIARTLSD
ncbi:MAG: formylglycine-generating enzyme family protein [Roseiflexus sp.]